MRIRLSFLAALVLASLAAHGAGVGGFIKPADATPKRVEQLLLGDSTAAELALPPLGAGAKRQVEGAKPNQIGISRRTDVEAAGALDASRLTWVPAAGGYASRIRVSSPGAVELRVGLLFTAMPEDLEVRAAARSGGEVSRTTASDLFKLTGGIWPIEHWTATSDGEAQVIELWTARKPEARQLAFRIVDVSHGFSKVTDFACHVDIACVPDSAARNAGKAVARMRFLKNGSSFVCSGSLINDNVNSMTPFFATANHCISTSAVAATLETWFFYYPSTCSGTAPVPNTPTKLTGGATLLMADFDNDFTLLRLMNAAPAGSLFLGWDPSPVAIGTAVFGVHHPNGESQRYMGGSVAASVRVRDSDTGITFGQPFYRVAISQGLIEGGSSGSPLLTAPDRFRGTLFGSPATNSCTSTTNTASYSEFAIAYPLVSTFLAGPNATDDYADSPGGAAPLPVGSRIVGQINRDGDVDWFRVAIGTAGNWTVSSFGPAGGVGADVIGEIYANDGVTRLAMNDDRSATDRNFQMVFLVPSAGTYFVKVSARPGVTGAYGLQTIFELPDDHGNSPATATPLAAHGSASGGLQSATDQDWFRITFDGPGTFAVRSTGTTDMYGRLYRSDGTTIITENDDIVLGVETNFQLSAAVNGADTYYLQVTGFDGDIGNYGLTATFTAGSGLADYTDLWWNAAESGWGINLNHQSDIIFATLFTYAPDMRNMWLVASSLPKQPDGSYAGPLYRLTGPAFFTEPWTTTNLTQVGTMRLTFASPESATLVYTFNGTTVTKTITRQRFGTPPVCTFTTAPRTGATNYQDLWYNANEPGWGINITQQGSVIFATLFTYGTDGRDVWLVADALRKAPSGGAFSGTLYRPSGPPFNQVPWTPVTLSTVGTMSLSFTNGAAGTLTYTVDGVQVVKQIQRQVFGAQPTVCQ